VEDPLEFTRADVVTADVAWRRRLPDRAVADHGTDDDRVADDRRRRAVRDGARIDPASEVRHAPLSQQVDLAARPETANGLPGDAVERDQAAVVRGQEDPDLFTTAAILFDRTAPRGDAAMLEADVRRPAGAPGLGIVGPEGLAGGRVDGRRLGHLGGDVEHAVEHDRDRLELPRLDRPVRLGDGGRRGLPLPGHLELVEVRVVDLIERRVLRVVRAVSESGPFDHGVRVLGRARESQTETSDRECR